MDTPAEVTSAARLRTRRLRAVGILDSGPEPALDALAKIASQVCEVPIALVTLLDTERQWFKARVGLEVASTPIEHAFCATALRDDAALVVEDAALDPRFAGNPLVTAHPNIRFYAGVPIHLRPGIPVGTLCAIDSRPRTITPMQLDILRGLALQAEHLLELRQTSTKLQAAREHETTLERQLREVEIAEARRIAAELHDGLGQDLLVIQLSLVEILPRRHLLDADMAARVTAIAGQVAAAATRCREMAYSHASYSTEELGLVRCLQRYCDQLTDTMGRSVLCSTPPALLANLDPNTSQHLLRIAQEAVTNALRHSEAQTIRVSIVESPRRLWLTVEDDGRGLPAGALSQPGAGLRSMLFRAGEIGADLRIENAPGSGVQVECILMLAPDTE